MFLQESAPLAARSDINKNINTALSWFWSKYKRNYPKRVLIIQEQKGERNGAWPQRKEQQTINTLWKEERKMKIEINAQRNIILYPTIELSFEEEGI